MFSICFGFLLYYDLFCGSGSYKHKIFSKKNFNLFLFQNLIPICHVTRRLGLVNDSA